MVSFGSSVPLWASVPVVSRPVFIGTRSADPYGHSFYAYFVGTSITTLTPITPTELDDSAIAFRTAERLLPFVDPVTLVPFVRTAKLRLLPFGLARREHIILTFHDPTQRWWLYAPIAEVNRLVIDDEIYDDVRIVNGDLFIGDDRITMLDQDNKAVLLVPARTIEIHYAIDTLSPVVDEALPYFVAAAYLKAASDNQSGIYETIRVGAVTFSFRSVKELKDKAAQLERIGLQMLRAGGRL